MPITNLFSGYCNFVQSLHPFMEVAKIVAPGEAKCCLENHVFVNALFYTHMAEPKSKWLI